MENLEVLQPSPIETALTSANITDKVIEGLKEYLPLTINGIEDKEGYEKVKSAATACKKTRVLAEKICKKGREEAIAIQKKWVAKEKEVVAQIEEVEVVLTDRLTEIDLQVETEKKKQIALKQLPNRVAKLATIGKTATDEELLAMDDVRFFNYFQSLYDAHILEQQAALKAEQDKVIAEKAAIEAQRAQEAAEKQRQADIAAAAQQAKEAAELAAKQAIEKAEKDKADAIAKAERDAKELAERIECEKAEAAAKAEQDKQDAILAEQKRAKDAADKIEADRMATIAKEKLQRELEAKAAELAPDKDKLLKLAETLALIEMPQLNNEQAKYISLQVKEQINGVIKFIKQYSQSL